MQRWFLLVVFNFLDLLKYAIKIRFSHVVLVDTPTHPNLGDQAIV